MTSLTDAIRRHADDVLLLLTSFDGVLAEYQSDPAAVSVPAKRLDLLRRLQGSPNVVTAVISGRPLDDLRPRLPLGDQSFYIGLHGLEIVGPGLDVVRSDAIDAFCARMRQVADRLDQQFANVPGVRLEYKGPIVALHTRDADPDDVVWSRFQLLSAAADMVNTESVRAIRGQQVLELLPNVGHSRAQAVQTVERLVEERHQHPVFTIYIGADWPDDDALELAGENHLSAVIGRRTHVGHHLESSGELDAFLSDVLAERGDRSSR